jgi:hypothetical protein
VYGYESGKDTAGGFKPRPDLDRGSHPLTQRARAMRKRNEWHQRLNPDLPAAEPELFVEPIAAGEKVVASQRSQTAKLITKHYSDAIAVEMEGRGFLEAAHVHATIAVVIRGISDLLSKKAAADKEGWQKRAADAASAVAFEMLHKLSSAQPLAAPKKGQPPAANQPAKKARRQTSRRLKRSAPATRRPPPVPEAPATTSPARFQRMPHTLNEGAFFSKNEARPRRGAGRR